MKKDTVDFNFFVPVEIEKAQNKKGEKVMKIKGIASTADRDGEGEILEPVGFDLSRFLSTGFLNWNHQAKNDASKIIGEPTVAKVTPKGELYVEGVLYNGHPLAESVWNLAETLEQNGSNRRIGFSIEGKALERDIINPKRITKALLTGLAVTPTPVNTNTYLELCKGVQKSDFIEPEFDVDFDKSKDEKYLYEFNVGDKQYAINKSFELVDIEKAEGDRGGKVIGHTSSGKPIYEDNKYKDWTAQQHTEQSWQHHGAFIRAEKTGKQSVADWEKNEMNKHIRWAAEKTKKELQKKSIEPDIEKEDDVQYEKGAAYNKSKIRKVMSEFKAGTLKTSAGDLVTDRDQALAIALNEAKIEKSMAANIGEIRFWGGKKYKKQYNNKWLEVHEGKTKEDYKRLLVILNKDKIRLNKEQKNSISASRQLDSTIDKIKQIRNILNNISGDSIDIPEEVDKAMDTTATKPLHPESLDGVERKLEPIIKKAILEGVIPIDKIKNCIKK